MEKIKSDGAVAFLELSSGHARMRWRRFIEREIPGQRLLWGCWQFRRYTEWRYWAHRRRFKAAADPHETIVINPQELDEYNPEVGKEWGLGRIIGGDWDHKRFCKRLAQNVIYVGIRQRFVEGRSWDQTDYYRMAQYRLSHIRDNWGFRDLDEFLEVRCRYVDRLYEAIEKDGYRPNMFGNHDVPVEDRHRANKAYIHRLEPLVVIGRSGEIYLRDGLHRISIARLLGIKKVPVHVLARHRAWQSEREQHASRARHERPKPEGGRAMEMHPDLQDIVCSYSE